MISAMRATLLVLAGGQSRRMGRPKAMLPVAGGTLIEWMLDRLAPGFQEALVAAGPETELPPLQTRVVEDRLPGAGPLAGIEAGLGAARSDVVFAVACDMPFVSLELARKIVRAAPRHDAAVPRLDGRPEPACAAYRRSARGAIESALRQGRLRAAEVLGDLDVRWLDDLDPAAFKNINTPDDYQDFLDALPKPIIGP